MSLILAAAFLAAVQSPPVSASGPAPAPAATPVTAPATPVPVPTPVPAPAAPGRSPEVLAKERADLAALLAGRWDNDLQVFFEPELEVPVALRHARVHAFIRPAPPRPDGAAAFYVEHRAGGEEGAILRQRVWTLAPDAALDGVRMQVWTPRDPKPLESAWRDEAGLRAVATAELAPVAGCDILWKRRAGGFSGETRPGACRVVTVDGDRTVVVSERHDLTPDAWDVRDIGVDERGTRVFGAPDGAPTRFRRARPFVCWLGVTEGGETRFARDLPTHDQGGVARFGAVRLKLRNVEWPVGDNRPSLTLYLFDEPEGPARAFAWTEPDGRRIAVNAGRLQASCTADAGALWR
jgi:hypothetical protein